MKVYLDVLFMDVESARGHWLSRLAWWGLLLTRLRRPQFIHVMCRYRINRISGEDDADYVCPWVSLSPWGFNYYKNDDDISRDVTLDTTKRISVCLGTCDNVDISGRWVFVNDMLPVVEPKFNPQTRYGAVRFYIGAILTGLGISRWSRQFPVCTDPVWWRLIGRVNSYGHLTPDALWCLLTTKSTWYSGEKQNSTKTPCV